MENYGCNLFDKAKDRALRIVTRMDITERVLRDKLEGDGYPADIINQTVIFMKEHSFVNDERYAKNYVCYKSDTRSRRQIEAYLYSKGISSDIITEACDEFYADNEGAQRELIKKLIAKRKVNLETMTYDEKKKLIAYLAGKGFCFEDISSVIKEMNICDFQ